MIVNTVRGVKVNTGLEAKGLICFYYYSSGGLVYSSKIVYLLSSNKEVKKLNDNWYNLIVEVDDDNYVNVTQTTWDNMNLYIKSI